MQEAYLLALVRSHPELAMFLTIVAGHLIGRLQIKKISLGTVVSVGYSAGPQFFASLRREALPQTFLAVIVACTGLGAAMAMVALFRFDAGGLLVGHFVLKMPPLALLPGIAGAQTTVATLNALKERGGSNVFAVGFTVPFAVGNVLIALWGPLIVAFAFAIA